MKNNRQKRKLEAALFHGRSFVFAKKLASTLLFFALTIPLVPVEALAVSVAPSVMSYQGRLADSSGNLLGGSGTTFYFKFSIWNNATVGSGSRLWPSVAPSSFSTTVRQGVFNVNIGDTANGFPHALDYDWATNSDVYLQVDVSSDNASFQELTPRLRITSGAYAQLAGAVSGTSTPSTFGTTSPIGSAQVTIEATSSGAIALALRGAASQSGNLLQAQNSAGASLFTITGGGKVGIGTSSPYGQLAVVGEVVAALFTATTTATSTFAGGIRTASLDLTSIIASSTFANGIDLSGGCFAIGGTCLSTGETAAGGTGAIQFANGTTFTGDATNFFWNDTSDYLGIGTSTPTAKLQLASVSRPQLVLTDTGGRSEERRVGKEC